jgi:hypothetical protein
MQPFAAWAIDHPAAEPRNRQSYQEPCGVMPARLFAAQQQLYPFRRCRGTTMDVGLQRIEWTGLAGLRGRTRQTAAGFSKTAWVWLPATLVVGLAGWMLLSGRAANLTGNEPVPLAVAAATEATQPAATDGSTASLSNATTQPAEAARVEPTPVDGLRISSQYWRRGGLGSNALVTFTLRNGNDYAVRDIEISCAFSRRDGSHLTDRTRTIHDTVNMKSRRTFARMHVGFVNINASNAKCAPVAASRI